MVSTGFTESRKIKVPAFSSPCGLSEFLVVITPERHTKQGVSFVGWMMTIR
jgi:hypothetical protein